MEGGRRSRRRRGSRAAAGRSRPGAGSLHTGMRPQRGGAVPDRFYATLHLLYTALKCPLPATGSARLCAALHCPLLAICWAHHKGYACLRRARPLQAGTKRSQEKQQGGGSGGGGGTDTHTHTLALDRAPAAQAPAAMGDRAVEPVVGRGGKLSWPAQAASSYLRDSPAAARPLMAGTPRVVGSQTSEGSCPCRAADSRTWLLLLAAGGAATSLQAHEEAQPPNVRKGARARKRGRLSSKRFCGNCKVGFDPMHSQAVGGTTPRRSSTFWPNRMRWYGASSSGSAG